MTKTDPVARLMALLDRLRAPDGCPWDKVQTPESMAGYLVEEAAETAQAIAEEGPEAVCEELGDLLFQLLFVVHIYDSAGLFGLTEVAAGVEAKMIRRHPHVFDRARAETPDQVIANWEAIKRTEKAENGGGGLMDSVPRGLPALMRAHRLSKKAASVGFDWPSAEPVLAKVEEELAELKAALDPDQDPAATAEELGDLFFSLANLTRHLGFHPEEVAQAANAKFQARFKKMERLAEEGPKSLLEMDDQEMDTLWEAVKAEESGTPGNT